jgi:hypothetical protein
VTSFPGGGVTSFPGGGVTSFPGGGATLFPGGGVTLMIGIWKRLWIGGVDKMKGLIRILRETGAKTYSRTTDRRIESVI